MHFCSAFFPCKLSDLQIKTNYYLPPKNKDIFFKNMLITFRVSELQMLLGFAGRNKSGRKTELQQRALELLRVRSHPIHQKIRDLYKTIQ